MITEPTPLYDRLRVMRDTFQVGLRAAELSGCAERTKWYTQALAGVEAQIEALQQPIGGAERGADIKKLRRAYTAKQVTPKEFGARMRWLVRQ